MQKYTQYLPDFWEKFAEIPAIGEVVDKRCAELKAAFEKTKENYYFDIMDDKTLARWRDIYGTFFKDRNAFLAMLVSQSLEGLEGVQEAAGEYLDCEAIAVLNDAGITVKFCWPEVMDSAGVYSFLRDMIPANLPLYVAQVAGTFAYFDSLGRTWSAWDALNLTWHKKERYIKE